MIQERKRVLIVDDTEIDRIILKSILGTEFEVFEANSGNVAFEYITTRADQLDVVLLDISMPHIDGFDVLRFMRQKGLDIPVFLVTAEPTRENVEKALQYKVAEFIGKPFDKDEILRRLRSRLGVIPVFDRQECDMTETMRYVNDLEGIFQSYLTNFGKNDEHYKVMVDLMRILLNTYRRENRGSNLDNDSIEIISRAAYFCDIGEILVPDKRLQAIMGNTQTHDMERAHTILGSNLVRMNRAKNCGYFVEVCSSMCQHHHERYDGTGYPNGIAGRNNSIYNQMCRLADEFDLMLSKFYGGDKAKPVKFVVKGLKDGNSGLVSPELCGLLEDCEEQIFNYFLKKNF